MFEKFRRQHKRTKPGDKEFKLDVYAPLGEEERQRKLSGNSFVDRYPYTRAPHNIQPSRPAEERNLPEEGQMQIGHGTGKEMGFGQSGEPAFEYFRNGGTGSIGWSPPKRPTRVPGSNEPVDLTREERLAMWGAQRAQMAAGERMEEAKEESRRLSKDAADTLRKTLDTEDSALVESLPEDIQGAAIEMLSGEKSKLETMPGMQGYNLLVRELSKYSEAKKAGADWCVLSENGIGNGKGGFFIYKAATYNGKPALFAYSPNMGKYTYQVIELGNSRFKWLQITQDSAAEVFKDAHTKYESNYKTLQDKGADEFNAFLKNAEANRDIEKNILKKKGLKVEEAKTYFSKKPTKDNPISGRNSKIGERFRFFIDGAVEGAEGSAPESKDAEPPGAQEVMRNNLESAYHFINEKFLHLSDKELTLLTFPPKETVKPEEHIEVFFGDHGDPADGAELVVKFDVTGLDSTEDTYRISNIEVHKEVVEKVKAEAAKGDKEPEAKDGPEAPDKTVAEMRLVAEKNEKLYEPITQLLKEIKWYEKAPSDEEESQSANVYVGLRDEISEIEARSARIVDHLNDKDRVFLDGRSKLANERFRKIQLVMGIQIGNSLKDIQDKLYAAFKISSYNPYEALKTAKMLTEGEQNYSVSLKLADTIIASPFFGDASTAEKDYVRNRKAEIEEQLKEVEAYIKENEKDEKPDGTSPKPEDPEDGLEEFAKKLQEVPPGTSFNITPVVKIEVGADGKSYTLSCDRNKMQLVQHTYSPDFSRHNSSKPGDASWNPAWEEPVTADLMTGPHKVFVEKTPDDPKKLHAYYLHPENGYEEICEVSVSGSQTVISFKASIHGDRVTRTWQEKGKDVPDQPSTKPEKSEQTKEELLSNLKRQSVVTDEKAKPVDEILSRQDLLDRWLNNDDIEKEDIYVKNFALYEAYNAETKTIEGLEKLFNKGLSPEENKLLEQRKTVLKNSILPKWALLNGIWGIWLERIVASDQFGSSFDECVKNGDIEGAHKWGNLSIQRGRAFIESIDRIFNKNNPLFDENRLKYVKPKVRATIELWRTKAEEKVSEMEKYIEEHKDIKDSVEPSPKPVEPGGARSESGVLPETVKPSKSVEEARLLAKKNDNLYIPISKILEDEKWYERTINKTEYLQTDALYNGLEIEVEKLWAIKLDDLNDEDRGFVEERRKLLRTQYIVVQLLMVINIMNLKRDELNNLYIKFKAASPNIPEALKIAQKLTDEEEGYESEIQNIDRLLGAHYMSVASEEVKKYLADSKVELGKKKDEVEAYIRGQGEKADDTEVSAAQEWHSTQSKLEDLDTVTAIETLETFVKKHSNSPEAAKAKQEAFRQLLVLFNTLLKDQESTIVLKMTMEEYVGRIDDTQTNEDIIAILVEEDGQPELKRLFRSAIVAGPTYKEKPKESELYNKERKRIRAQLENGNTVPLLKFADLCTELGFDSDAESVEHIMRVIQKAPTIFGEDIIATMKSSKLTEDEKKRLPINTPDEPGSSEKAEIPEDQSGPVASQKQPPRAHFVSLNRATPSPSTAPTSTPTPTPSTAEVPQSYPDRPHIEYHRYGDGNFRVESKDRIESIYHVSGDVTQTKEEFLQSLMLLVWRPAEGTEYSVKRLANITSHLSKSREWEIHLRCRALSSRSLYLKRSADGRIWKIGFGISDKVTDINDPEIPETLRKIGEKYIGKPFNDVQATLLDSELRAELCNLFQTPAVSICEAACVFQPTEDPQAISSRLFSKDSFLVNDGNEWRKQFRKNGRFPYDNFVNVIVDEPRDFAFLNQLAERIDLKVTFSKGPIANAVIEDLDLTMSYIPPSIQSVLDSFSEHKYPLTPETIQKIHREVTYAITDLRTLSQEERQQMLSDQELYIEKTFNQIMYEMKEIKKSFPNYTEEQFARATELAKENKRIREGLTLVWRRKNQQWKWKPVEFEWPMNTYEWSIKKINGVPREEYKEKERKLQERIAQNHEDWDRLQEEHKRERDESEKREQEKLEEEKREQDRLEREERDREKSSIIYRTNKWLRKHHFL